MTRDATPPADSIWLLGSRTVRQTCEQTGLSRQELFELMAEGVLVWMAHGGRGTRLIAWSSVVAYLEGQHAEYEQTAGAATA